ncbi:unnamed protein product [Rhizophagus irregularis]|nr:unnamed protein product [Rhizophagus irregularis]
MRSFIDGLYEGDSNEPVNNCFTVLPNSLKKSFVHILTVQETKECGVKYYKIVPADVESCPYIIIISKGIHAHLPPPPNHVPLYYTNKNCYRKSYKNVLRNSDMCASLNNADRLRYFVNKIQKEINPQGYRLLGVVYNYSHSNIDNFCDYVKRLCRCTIKENSRKKIWRSTEENTSDWISFYRQKWVIGS